MKNTQSGSGLLPTQSERLRQWRAQASAHWQVLGERERLLVAAAATALALLLLWSVALRPALNTLARTPAQLSALDTQLLEMQRLAQEARELRALPPVSAGQAQAALKAASERLGPQAKLNITGDRAVLTFSGIAPEALQSWLGEARGAARARQVEANLQRGPQGFGGTVVLALGAGA